MRRVRLRQWLVLLLRTLIILLIVGAFARPAYQTQGTPWGGRAVPTAALILFDQSYSTTFRLPAGRLFDQLQQQALALLNLFDARDQVILVPFAGRPAPADEETGDKARLEERVRELLPRQEATRFEPALQAAAQYLSEKQGLNPEVFLLTDLAPHDWSAVEDKQEWLPNTPVYIHTPEPGERSNIHIDAVRLPSWMTGPGNKLAVQVTLTNSSAQSLPGTPLNLYIDAERVRRQEVNLAPGEKAQVEFTITPRRTGRLTGYVEVEDDGLLLDNRRFFALDIPEKINVLAVGHQPSDTYYPRRGLKAAALADPILEVRSGFVDELDAAQLQDIHVLLLCNLQRLNAAQTALVHGFVAAGGGLIIFPSPQAALNFYNRDLLPGLVPARFKGVFGDYRNTAVFQQLDQDRHHPLFQDLLPQIPADQPHFYASFELTARDNLQPLIHFTDGKIALAAAWREQGRTLLFAAPLSLDWNDLPTKGLFVPLLHRLIRYLRAPLNHRESYLVGQTVHRHLDDIPIESTIQAETPAGNRLLISPELIDGRYFWKIPRVEESGLWRLWKDGEMVDSFPVNVDTRESVLTPVDQDRLARLFGQDRTHFIRSQDDLRARILGRRYGRELWRECLVLALILLLAELWIARAPRGRAPEAASPAAPN